MDARQEMAGLVREVIGELIHMPIQVLTLNTNRSSGEVTGRFRGGQVIYDYRIKGDDVTYRPMGSEPGKARADGIRDRRHAVVDL